MAQNALKYWGDIEANSKLFGLDPRLVAGVIQQESGGNPYALSPVGAQGLMQLMPKTARDLSVTNSYDPKQNIQGGVRYLASLMKRYNNDVGKALLAYNWGMGNVDAYIKTGKGMKGQAMPKEAREYAGKVQGKMTSLFDEKKADSAPTGARKWFMAMPSTGLIGAGLASIGAISQHEDGVIAGASDMLDKSLPDFGGIVDSAGNFVLRSVVILSAIAIIVLGFYFMFKQEINSTVKAVTN